VYIWAGPNGRARSTKKKPGPSTTRHEINSGWAGPTRCIGPCLGRRRGPRAGTSPARLIRPELARLLARKGPKFIAAHCPTPVLSPVCPRAAERERFIPCPNSPPFFSRVPIRRRRSRFPTGDSHPTVVSGSQPPRRPVPGSSTPAASCSRARASLRAAAVRPCVRARASLRAAYERPCGCDAAQPAPA
jgi:hypothetical protein